MEFTEFVRKPFVVTAVEVTPENIKELSEMIGTMAEKADGTPYIEVDPDKVRNISKVYPGFFVTKMGSNIRCYSRRTFIEQFTEMDDNIRVWVDFLNTKETANAGE